MSPVPESLRGKWHPRDPLASPKPRDFTEPPLVAGPQDGAVAQSKPRDTRPLGGDQPQRRGS
jgi:hypothetical protein